MFRRIPAFGHSLLGVVLLIVALPAAAGERAYLAWTELTGARYELYFSDFAAGRWSERVNLSIQGVSNVAPAVSRAPNGRVWVAWSGVDDEGRSALWYRVQTGGAWSEARSVATGLEYNTGVNLAVAPDGTPWMVWAGDDGTGDDIYYSRWNGAAWDPALKVSRPDGAPDILPVLGFSPRSGQPWLAWSGYESGRYEQFASLWNGAAWSAERRIDPARLEALKARTLPLVLQARPAFVSEQAKTALHVPGAGQVQSLEVEGWTAAASAISTQALAKASVIGAAGMGDSITKGSPYVASNGNGQRVGGYEPKLEVLLAGAGMFAPVYNWGVSGETTSQGVNRIASVIAAQPVSHVLILEGVNDEKNGISFRTTVFNLYSMTGIGWSMGVTPVIGTMPPDTKSGYRPIIDYYNIFIRLIANFTGARLADHNATLGPAWGALTYDGLHPNDVGYQVMAETWFYAML
jgi:lysophospholipase L1-like esterase